MKKVWIYILMVMLVKPGLASANRFDTQPRQAREIAITNLLAKNANTIVWQAWQQANPNCPVYRVDMENLLFEQGGSYPVYVIQHANVRACKNRQ